MEDSPRQQLNAAGIFDVYRRRRQDANRSFVDTVTAQIELGKYTITPEDHLRVEIDIPEDHIGFLQNELANWDIVSISATTERYIVLIGLERLWSPIVKKVVSLLQPRVQSLLEECAAMAARGQCRCSPHARPFRHVALSFKIQPAPADIAEVKLACRTAPDVSISVDEEGALCVKLIVADVDLDDDGPARDPAAEWFPNLV
jgi:hypothetical protein